MRAKTVERCNALRKLAENSLGTCARDESACYHVPAARRAGLASLLYVCH